MERLCLVIPLREVKRNLSFHHTFCAGPRPTELTVLSDHMYFHATQYRPYIDLRDISKRPVRSFYMWRRQVYGRLNPKRLDHLL